MKFLRARTLGEIADRTHARLSDPAKSDIEIAGIATADRAEEGDIVWAETREAVKGLSSSRASAAIVPPSARELPIPTLIHPLPKLVFGMLLEEFVPNDEGDPATAAIHSEASIDPRAVICGNVKVGARTIVRAGAVLGYGVEIGEDCQIGYNAVLNWGSKLGNRVIVHGCAVLGTDGFGYVQKPLDDDPTTFESLKIPHVGNVVVGDDVEIGANVCIDRGLLGPTVIGKGTKIDNLVQIGHNCQIGEHNILVGLVGFSGSVTTGKNVIAAGQAGIADHSQIGDRTILMAATKGAGEIPPDSKVIGYPPLPRGDFWKYTSSLMDVTLVKKILKAAQKAASFEDFKKEIADLKPLGWTFRKK
jgi:UDP-3-O-[3-hydroxymyristoyl] glucosamine N-acyltransferase